MEKMGKKLIRHSKRQIQSSSEESQPDKKSKVRKLNKKLAKGHRKNKGKICMSQFQSSCLVEGPLHRMASILSTPKEEIFPSLRGKFNKMVHVKNIIDKDVARCYPRTKDNYQDSIRAYKELITLGGYCHQIETIGIKSLTKGTPMSISYIRDHRANPGSSQVHSRRTLHPNEVTLIQRRQQLMSQIATFVQGQQMEKGYPLEPVDEVLLEILTLTKLNASIQSQIQKDMERLINRQDPLFQCHDLQEIERRQNALQCAYAQALVVKNLELSLDETPIDFLNYHLRIHKYQENTLGEENFLKLTTMEEFQQYAQSKKPKSRKSTKFLLKTPCSACFSHFSEITNPILNCPECHMRVHQSCQNLENRCHRCRYSRTSNKEKQLSSYCYICHRDNEKGTMIQTVTNQYPHQYAHSYCLLLHKYWKIEQGAVKGNYIPQPQQQQAYCLLCGKTQGHFFRSTCCGNSVHGMCAYLQGCSLRMNKGVRNDYQIEAKCCIDPDARERLRFERRFKLNWQKVVFRSDRYLFSYIREHIRRPDIEE